MRKEDWVNVIESTFNEVSFNGGNNKYVVEGDFLKLRDEGVSTTIKLPCESKVYSIDKDLEEIQILTKNYNDIDGFTGSCIIVSKHLETCMLLDVLSLNYSSFGV